MPKKSIFLRASVLLFLVLNMACGKKFSSVNEISLDSKLNGLSASDNGQSYDGKIVYLGRDKVLCNGQAVSKVQIVGDGLTGHFTSLTRIQQPNGSCLMSSQADVNVEEFRSSQLAEHEGKINDMVVKVGDLVLDNLNTRVVCKLDPLPLVLLDNELTGAVIMQSANPSIWNSRLDFKARSQKTDFMYDQPPQGQLIQLASSLEFQTSVTSTNPAAGIKQLLHIKVDRPYVDTLSPSKNFGQKVYPGTFQYFYVNTNPQSPFSVSLSPMPSTCFVDQINQSLLSTDPNQSNFDFNAHLIQLLQQQ